MRQGEFVTGLACIVLGLAITWLASDGTAPPARETLSEARGTLTHVERSKGVLRFRLSGDPRLYAYPSRNGAFVDAQDAIANAGEARVRVLFDGALVRDGRYSVYEVEVAGRWARTYGQVREAWSSNDDVGLLLALAFGVAGVWLVARASRAAPTA
jgi:hypothetical protein